MNALFRWSTWTRKLDFHSTVNDLWLSSSPVGATLKPSLSNATMQVCDHVPLQDMFTKINCMEFWKNKLGRAKFQVGDLLVMVA